MPKYLSHSKLATLETVQEVRIIMQRYTRLERIEYEDKWVTDKAFQDESGLIRGKAIDSLAEYENANKNLGCEECSGAAGMEIPLSTGIKNVSFCPVCGRKF